MLRKLHAVFLVYGVVKNGTLYALAPSNITDFQTYFTVRESGENL